MIGKIIRKELLINLLSLRFLVGLVVSVTLMGIVGYVLVEDYAARQQTYLSDVQLHRNALAEKKVFSTIEVVVDIPPSPLSAFSRGGKNLPTSIRVSPYHVPSLLDEAGGGTAIALYGTSNRPSNPLLRVFTPIDLSMVIGTILSLFSVLLVFDSFSGEREQGTLKLLLSASAGRVHLLLGKYLGALVTLAIPLTIGFLEIMILWGVHPGLAFDGSVWAGAGLMYIASLLFLSSFLALALLLSLFARESSSCLMYLLLGWVGIVIAIPEGGGYIAEVFRPHETRVKMLLESDQANTEFQKTIGQLEYHQTGSWNNVSITYTEGESFLGITAEEAHNRLEYNKKAFPLKFRLAEEKYRIVESYASALKMWSRTRDNLIQPSLYTMYKHIVQAVAGTDVSSFEYAVRNSRVYRASLMTYLQPRVERPEWFTRVFDYPDVQPTDHNMKYWQSIIEKEGERAVERILSWDRIAPLDLSSMPQPTIVLPGIAERLGHVVVDLVFLVGTIVVFLALAMLRVVRYPVE